MSCVNAAIRAVLLGALILIAGMPNARAAADVSVADLEAATRALGFLDSLRKDGTIVVGIIFMPGNAESRGLAERTATSLARLGGPNSTIIKAEFIGADKLAEFSGRLDAVFLLPGVAASATTVGETLRRLHVVSISNDPACIQSRCCVLMIRTGGRVDIVLDTAMAEAVGARFSSVFAMMVKRI